MDDNMFLSHSQKYFSLWSNNDIIIWLKTLGLSKDYKSFIELTQIVGSDLLNVTPDYLEKIQIKNNNDKIKIVNAISNLMKEKYKFLNKNYIKITETDQNELKDNRNYEKNEITENNNKRKLKTFKNLKTKLFDEKNKDRFDRFNEYELVLLEKFFYKNPKCSKETVLEIARYLKRPFRKIEIWFTNRRSKTRKNETSYNMKNFNNIPINNFCGVCQRKTNIKIDSNGFQCTFCRTEFRPTIRGKNKAPMMNCSKCKFLNHVASSKCSLCGHPFPKALKSANYFQKNSLMNSNFNPLNESECKLCGKRFSKPSIVKRHMRVHTGEKPYNCSYCSKAFSQNQDRKRHEMAHTGKKPFHCHLCGKGFIRKNRMNHHISSHRTELSRENSYESSLNYQLNCVYNTNSSLQNLNSFQIKIKKFHCNYCEKKFDRNMNLVHHERTHTGERPFECKICDKKFKQQYHAQRHLKTHYNKIEKQRELIFK